MGKVLFFDFFGVICSEISPTWFKKHLNEIEAMEVKEEIMSRADLGIISEDEVYKIIENRFNVNASTVKKEWQDLIKINNDLVSKIKLLKKEHKVILVSNAMSSFLRRILDNHNLNELFDSQYISAEIKLAKPNKEYFEYVINKEKINKDDIIFFDDSIKNINAARSLGIKSILFTKQINVINEING